MPLPVRVAAGLMATALEQARKLPEQLAELPITAASRAVQAGMRVQQRVTELAIKGDEVFSLFHRVEDTPSWARFDEDDENDAAQDSQPHSNGTGTANGDTGKGSLAMVVPGPGGPGTRTTVATAPTAGAPLAMPGYDEMSLAQLRGKLRGLSLPELEALLDHEHAHQDRAPFVTMLSNRISTVRTR
ncbi:MAG: lipid droplet-associated protein [Pseudonocardiaceae bacterium]